MSDWLYSLTLPSQAALDIKVSSRKERVTRLIEVKTKERLILSYSNKVLQKLPLRFFKMSCLRTPRRSLDAPNRQSLVTAAKGEELGIARQAHGVDES